MRTLKTRLRPDNIPNERRVERGSTSRIVYLAFLGIFALAVANYLFGDILVLRADGLVLREQNVVATTYIARVERVFVKEGQAVDKGTELLKLQSLEILERLADLSTKRAELAAKVADFKVRSERTEKLLPLAERREAESERVLKQFDSMAKDGFVRSAPYAEALSANYAARRDRVSLSAESRVLKDELSALAAALTDAEAALRDLDASYADGLVRAPATGAVGATVPSVGDVYRPGDPLLTTHSGEPYVLVYLPRRYIFPIHVGMRVEVTDGQRLSKGIVAEILPLTASLPKEFQNTFQPLNRNQLAKIRLSRRASFPFNQKVAVTRASWR